MTLKASSGPVVCALLMVGCVAGCKGLFGTQGLPHDPLFLDRTPVEAKGRYTVPFVVAYSEPLPPDNPFLANQAARPVPGKLTNRPHTEPAPEQNQP